MAATYPNDIATLVNPNASDKLNQPSHSQIETRQNEEIVALETELGLGLKGTLTTLAERLSVGVNEDGTLKSEAISIESLSDVTLLSALSDGQLLRYDSGLTEWVNWTPNFLTEENDPVFTSWFSTLGGQYQDDFEIADWQGISAPYSITYTALTHGHGNTKNLAVHVTRDLGTTNEVVYDSPVIDDNGDVTIYTNTPYDGTILIGGLGIGAQGEQGIQGEPGLDGEDGREIELQNDTTYIQWRYVGDISWINLVALADLQGEDGADGREIELQSNGTYIQWRYVGEVSWTNLVALADLKGDQGDPGAGWTYGQVELGAKSSINITAGDKAEIRIPYNGTITGWEIVGSGNTSSIVVDIQKSSYSTYDTYSSIAGSEKPTLVSQKKNTDLTLSTWTTSIVEGDYLKAVVESCSDCTKFLVSLKITRS
jgi:hypothetical protein